MRSVSIHLGSRRKVTMYRVFDLDIDFAAGQEKPFEREFS
jgi:hypothetical protein